MTPGVRSNQRRIGPSDAQRIHLREPPSLSLGQHQRRHFRHTKDCSALPRRPRVSHMPAYEASIRPAERASIPIDAPCLPRFSSIKVYATSR
jgi:hypothetical protein